MTTPPLQPVAAETIARRIWAAIAERKLRPGTRLKEEELADIFSVSRARVRQALVALERDGMVTLVPNRGAFVSEPTVEEARDVFFARKVMEGRLIERLIDRITPAEIETLRAHVREERRAHAESNFAAVVRLSGEFHLRLAELSGSRYLHQVLRDLVSRTSLITAMHQPNMMHNCGPDEHEQIVLAIAGGETARAKHLMEHHLTDIENALQLDDTHAATGDLRRLLAE